MLKEFCISLSSNTNAVLCRVQNKKALDIQGLTQTEILLTPN
jgi:hypothetical protein